VIRVAIVDDHPAVRLGLHTALRSEPGLVPVGTAAGLADLEPLLYRTAPDVVLLDYYLDGEDGLGVCREIKSAVPSPAVVIYSAYADPSLLVPAIVAGADAVVHKGVPAHELFEAIRTVARGASAIPPASPALLKGAAMALDPEDLPILGMLMDHTTPADIMNTVDIEHAELNARIHRMLEALKPSAATAQAAPRSTT
jgi:DNA-binding NarL/FixJ family response regulator